METLLSAALRYLEMGFSVIPALSQRRSGSTVKWKEYQTRLPTKEELHTWFDGRDDIGIAIVTGEISKCVVLDLDKKGGKDGEAAAQSVHGWECTGPLSRTGSGGLHAIYAWPGFAVGNLVDILPGVDLRGDGGFFYAPPSVHANGKRYEWIEELERPLPELPAWIIEASGRKERPAERPARVVSGGPEAAAEAAATSEIMQQMRDADPLEAMLHEGVPEGRRHDTALKISGRYLAMGLTSGAVLMLLREWNRKNTSPLDDADLARIVDDIDRKELMKRGTMPGEDGKKIDPGNREVALLALSERFRVDLDDLIRVGGAEPVYRFLSSGRVAEVKAQDMLNQQAFRGAMVAMCERVPVAVGQKSSPGWDYYLQVMLDLARAVEPGEEATNRGQIREWVTTHVEQSGAHAEDEPSIMPGDPRHYKGHLYIHIPTLRKHISAEHGVKCSGKELAQLLSAEGFVQRWLRFQFGRDSGKTAKRRMWGVPSDLLGEPADETL